MKGEAIQNVAAECLYKCICEAFYDQNENKIL